MCYKDQNFNGLLSAAYLELELRYIEIENSYKLLYTKIQIPGILNDIE